MFLSKKRSRSRSRSVDVRDRSRSRSRSRSHSREKSKRHNKKSRYEDDINNINSLTKSSHRAKLNGKENIIYKKMIVT
jgi:hypothetical protein